MISRRKLVQIVLGTAVAGAMVSLPATTATAKPTPDVLVGGLSSPKGLAVDSAGNPLVAQGTFGPPGPVISYELHGRNHGDATPLTGPLNLTDVALTPGDDAWALSRGTLFLQQEGSEDATPILNIRKYQKTDPDPYNNNPRDSTTESNPYGVAALPNGDALVADAAANDIIRVTPSGDAWTVARFSTETVSTAHLGPNSGLPPTFNAEAVPTSITMGPGGDVLVGQLMGFPFAPGSSHVWRLDPDAQGALCSVESPEAGCSVYESGFTAIQDVAFDTRNSALYVYELAAGGVFAFEEGFGTGDFPPAVLIQSKNGKRTELAAGQLSQPGGVAVGRSAGHVFVTDGVFSEGRLLEVTR